MSECTCFELPPEMWTTHYGAVEPGSTHEPNPDCPEHFRKPPRRLTDGTWSDGVDRHKRISDQTGYECDQSRMFVWWFAYGGKWVAERAEPFFDKEFEKWEEAVAYADRMARGEE